MKKNIVYGRNSALECLKKSKNIKKIYLQDNFANEEIMIQVKKSKAVYQFLPKNKLDKISENMVHQGIICEISEFEYTDLKTFFNNKKPKVILVIDSIEDPYNLGSLIRSAECFGVEAIILPKRRSVHVTPTVIKVSTGAVYHIPIILVNNITQTLKLLKTDYQMWIVAFDAKGTNTIQEINFDSSIAIVLGGENKGITTNIEKEADYVLKIPIYGKINSLNVGVAGAIAMNAVAEGIHGKATNH